MHGLRRTIALAATAVLIAACGTSSVPHRTLAPRPCSNAAPSIIPRHGHRPPAPDECLHGIEPSPGLATPPPTCSHVTSVLGRDHRWHRVRLRDKCVAPTVPLKRP